MNAFLRFFWWVDRRQLFTFPTQPNLQVLSRSKAGGSVQLVRHSRRSNTCCLWPFVLTNHRQENSRTFELELVLRAHARNSFFALYKLQALAQQLRKRVAIFRTSDFLRPLFRDRSAHLMLPSSKKLWLVKATTFKHRTFRPSTR